MKKTVMLKKNYEFRKVLSKGKYYSGEIIEAFILKNDQKVYIFSLFQHIVTKCLDFFVSMW